MQDIRNIWSTVRQKCLNVFHINRTFTTLPCFLCEGKKRWVINDDCACMLKSLVWVAVNKERFIEEFFFLCIFHTIINFYVRENLIIVFSCITTIPTFYLSQSTSTHRKLWIRISHNLDDTCTKTWKLIHKV